MSSVLRGILIVNTLIDGMAEYFLRGIFNELLFADLNLSDGLMRRHPAVYLLYLLIEVRIDSLCTFYTFESE